MNQQQLIEQLTQSPESIVFANVIAAIEANYNYTPQSFKNGETENAAGTNEGSCKVFAFAQLNDLSEEQTLACFGEHYLSVLATPYHDDHANIRNFMKTGWASIEFSGTALVAK